MGPAEQSFADRVADWYAELTWKRGDTVLRPDDASWLLLTPRWPQSYANNGLLLRADPGPEQILAWGDEHLGGAGLEHRHVFALCDLSGRTREALVAEGFSLDAEVIMARPLSDGPLAAPEGVVVEIVGAEDVEPLNRRLWREEWLPDASEETLRQLTGRRETYSRSGEMVALLVRDPATGEPVATTDVCVAGWAAEIDGVATLASHRGRGYGDAMLAEAVRIAAERGCTHTALTAMVDDWPKDWYARRGFVVTGPAWAASRHPAAGA